MFKVLVLQALYNLSDDQAEYQIKDRLSFRRFLDDSAAKNLQDKSVLKPPESLKQSHPQG